VLLVAERWIIGLANVADLVFNRTEEAVDVGLVGAGAAGMHFLFSCVVAVFALRGIGKRYSGAALIPIAFGANQVVGKFRLARSVYSDHSPEASPLRRGDFWREHVHLDEVTAHLNREESELLQVIVKPLILDRALLNRQWRCACRLKLPAIE